MTTRRDEEMVSDTITPRTDAVRHTAITKLVELPSAASIDGMTRYYKEEDFLRAIRLAMNMERELGELDRENRAMRDVLWLVLSLEIGRLPDDVREKVRVLLCPGPAR